ncbi:MAG: alpha-glucuronidase family glycosyl hydrolase [Pirellulales bacterium]
MTSAIPSEDQPLSGVRSSRLTPLVYLLLALVASASPLRADTGYDAWLRYEPVDAKIAAERYAGIPAAAVVLGESDVLASARDELILGLRGMLGRTLRVEDKLPKESALLLATFDDAKKAVPSLDKFPKLPDDGFWLKTIQLDGQNCLLVTAPNERGVLFGACALLRKIALAQPIAALNERHSPAAPVRMISHWDALDGSADGGLAGKSIFWDANHATKDLDRVRDYARLLASLGINALSINEPRAGPRLLTPAYRKELAELSAVLRPWGVRLFIALNSTNPPASDGGARSWNDHVAELYRAIPDFGGFVLDADWDGAGSMEQEAGSQNSYSTLPAPRSVLSRAAAINAIAAALLPHHGVVICRTCVCGQSPDSDAPETANFDPAKTAYELFQPLDGQLDDNVVLQIKHGPMNFQVREPPSPLFGALEKTNQAVEFQLTQEHLGQQRHLCFLVPMWKQALEFNMHAASNATPVKELVTGKTFNRPLGGFVAVSNARRASNWFGHDLAMANLYGFGRLAWDPNLTGKAIAEEWTRLTFGHDPLVVGTLVEMLLKSWRTYENYTGPLGAGTLTDAADSHYGPGIESSTSAGWAPWHNADESGLGKDRTAASGTGFISQYRSPVAERFESLETCPDELLLFMHRVPYTHPLKSGKTVIQHIYDAHYQGARDAAALAQQWESLAGRIDSRRHRAVLKRLQYQAGHAQLWRDAICTWFMNRSGIADNDGRVGNYPNRFEAEAMEREGYESLNVTPWETASGGQCAQCVDPSGSGALSMKFAGEAGWFHLNVRYFDENDGASKFKLLVAGQVVDQWTAGDTLPNNKPNGHTSTRHETRRVALRPGDLIRIEATTDAGERAAIDYLEVDPAGK